MCEEWHPLAGIPSDELTSALLSFILCPPEPFGRAVWIILFQAEMQKRGLYR